MDKTLFARLATKYADGFYGLDPNDFEGVDHRDRLKLMEDVTGTDVIRVSSDDFTARVDRAGHVTTKKKPKKALALPARTFRYTMSTANPVGFFGDILEVQGWNLLDFNKRGRPFLFGHNIHEMRHPLGTMSNVLKGAKEDEVKGQPVLAGNARFTEEGLNPFNDLTHDMVQSGNMPGGSVGFRPLETRAPTDEELSANKGLKKYSFISIKTSLVEFSGVPVGLDPDAVKRRGVGQVGIEARLALAISEGRYDEDVVAEFRHLMLGIEPEAKGRSFVPVGDLIPFSIEDGAGKKNTILAITVAGEGVALEPTGERHGAEIEIEVEAERADDDLTDEETEDLTRLETAIAASLVGEEEEEDREVLRDGDDDTSDDASASEARAGADAHTDGGVADSGNTSSPDLSATIRALDRMGIPVDAAELERAMVEPENGASVDTELRADVRALETFSDESRALIEHLEERIAFLEESLLPESASDDDGDDPVSRAEGDDGEPETGVHEYLGELTDADLNALVATS